MSQSVKSYPGRLVRGRPTHRGGNPDIHLCRIGLYHHTNVPGRNWARLVLAVLLGGIGTFSLVIDPVKWLMEGHAFGEAFAGMTVYSILFGLSRIVHLTFVILALVLMFRPAANPYYRTAA
ncbi:hypothetical protein LJK88_45590 [Paenibacillus sp. P26]|nr:hypothetical protein LJK88_45590 [Paenibacillus sp. P26]